MSSVIFSKVSPNTSAHLLSIPGCYGRVGLWTDNAVFMSRYVSRVTVPGVRVSPEEFEIMQDD